MSQSSKIVGYKKVFGFVLPDWVDENSIRNLLSFVMVGIVMLAILILFVSPNKVSLTTMKAAIASSSERLTQLRESSDGLKQVGSELTTTQQDAVFRAMPLDYSPDEAISSLRRTAFDSGVNIVGYTLAPGVLFQDEKKEFVGGSGGSAKGEAISFDKFVIKVDVSGEIRSIMKFVSRVETSLPWGVVSDLGIQEVAKLSPTSKAVQLNIQVTYFRPNLKKFDLTNLRRFTPDDLSLIKELSQYTSGLGASGLYDLTPAVSSSFSSVPVTSNSVDLFGGSDE